MGQPKTKSPKKPGKPAKGTKPSKPSVKRPVKPKIASPPKTATSAQTKAAEAALDAAEAERSPGYTVNTTAISCEYGAFRVWDYPGDFSTIAFYNYVTKETFTTYGRIGREWLGTVDKGKCLDFPIESHRPLEPGSDDRVTRFSRYALTYRAKNAAVERVDYSKFDTNSDETWVAYGQERKLKYVNKKRDQFSNWKGVGSKSAVPAPRRTGKPMQIAFHETATEKDLALKVRLSSDTAHFCINRASVLQWADPAERTTHINALNERAVGIEFVNTPVEEFDAKTKEKKFNLEKSTRGIYIKTNLTVDFHDKIHVPLEFLPPNAEKGWFDCELTIPKDDLLNFDALKAVKLGSPPEAILEESAGIVKLKNCRVMQFFRLQALLMMIEEFGVIPGLSLSNAEQHLSVVSDEDGRKCFLFDKAFRRDGDDYYYGIDVRKTGAMVHGSVFSPHNDGYLLGLHMYLTLIKDLPTAKSIQTIINLLASTKTPKNTKPLVLEEIVMFRHKSSSVEEPQTTPRKKIKVKDYIVLT